MSVRKIVVVAALTLLSLHAAAQSPLPLTPQMDLRARAMLRQVSLDDKLMLLGGVDNFYTHAVPSAGLKALKMSDGPVGTRTFGPSTAYTASILLAASWDTELAHRVGASLGDDARARGVHFLLAPGVNMYRSPLNGRNMEYLGEDPYLAGRIAVGYITGVQSKGVSATVKHFAANNSEYDRHRVNSVIDERTLRELYLPAFEMAVKQGHVGAVMDSYNLINGEHATQNGHLNNDILKGEWGFQNLLMSDWTATYDGVAAANGGLDLEMPYAKLMTPETLKAALSDGRLKQSVIDDKVLRLLRTAVQFGWLDRDQADTSIPQYSLAASRVALDEARAGITLLKNDKGLLPLDRKKIRTIAIVGPNAAIPVVGGGGSSRTTPFKADGIVAGFGAYLGEQVRVMYAPGLAPTEELFAQTDIRNLKLETKTGNEPSKKAGGDRDRHIAFWRKDYNGAGPQSKTPTTYHWTGEFLPASTGSYMVLVMTNSGDAFTVRVDGKTVMSRVKGSGHEVTQDETVTLNESKSAQIDVEYETRSAAPHIGLAIRARNEALPESSQKIIRDADAVLLAVGFDVPTEGEGFDRTYAMPGRQGELVAQVAALNPRTIVALTAGGAVETEPWLSRVPALIHTFYPGQEGARALAEIVFGERSPEGHLPFSWERTLADNPASAHYEEENGTKDVHYGEGLYLGYRFYTSMHKDPLFAFGFGLSYTRFEISGLKVKRISGDDVEVAFDVQNKGTREGATVAQVYVSDPSATVKRPAMELKQFAKVHVKSGEKQHVVLHLDRRAFQYYDLASSSWKLDPGAFTIMVGESSASITAQQPLQMM